MHQDEEKQWKIDTIDKTERSEKFKEQMAMYESEQRCSRNRNRKV